MAEKTWDEAERLFVLAERYMPDFGKHLGVRVGDFLCLQPPFESKGIVLLKESDDNFYTQVSWEREHPFIEIKTEAGARRIFLMKGMLYDQPFSFEKNTKYPVFHEHFRKDSSLRGVLTFFRVDFSLDTFAYYENTSHFRVIKAGNLSACSSLPEVLPESGSILEKEITRTIDFEARAEEVLKASLLKEFVATCKRNVVIH